MNEKDWKSRLGVVFSTNPDFEYKAPETEAAQTIPINQQKLIVSIDRRKRAGKQVTLVTGFVGNESDLIDLSKILKTKCGVGGSAKDGEIILQGDFREKATIILQSLGYKAKKGN